MLRLLLCPVVLAATLFASLPVPGHGQEIPRSAPGRLGRGRPGAFEANRGQLDPAIRFLLRAGRAALFFTEDGVLLKVGARAPEPGERRAPAAPALARMRFLGADPGRRIEAGASEAAVVNYLIGPDPLRWRTGVPTHREVVYRGLYPGVDLAYAADGGGLKGTYTVAPGADPRRIRWSYEGAAQVAVDAAGILRARVGPALVAEHAPVAWQEIGGRRMLVSVDYAVGPADVGFRVGAYDPAYPLVIDPTVEFSTFLGGGGSDEGRGLAVDTAGNIYLAGYATSTDFPTAGPIQPTNQGGYDVVVTKLDPTGTRVLFSTYLGGALDDLGRGVAVDGSGIYVTGYTNSSDFPTRNAYQPTNHTGHGTVDNSDAFVAKLAPDGASLLYATYLGGAGVGTNEGNAGQEWGLAIAVDAAGRAHVGGMTASPDFPLKNAVQATYGGKADGFAAIFDPSGGLAAATFLGGNEDDWVEALALDPSGNVYLTGRTNSGSFPVLNAYQAAYGGAIDGFATKLTAGGAALAYSTYLGGSGLEKGYGVAADGGGHVYIAGMTLSTDFPTTPGALRRTYAGAPATCPNGDIGGDVYLAKLDTTARGAASLVYGTYYGGSGCDSARFLAVDTRGNAYLTGWTDSVDLPLADAVQGQLGGGEDAFLAAIDPTGARLLFGTYLGGSGDDFGRIVAVDAGGRVYATGSTASADFPTLNALQPRSAGGTDDFLIQISGIASSGATSDCLTTPTFRVEIGPPQTLVASAGNPLMIRYCGPQRYVGSTDNATNLYALEAFIGGSQKCSAWAGDLPHRDANLVPGKWYDCLDTLNTIPTFSSYPATLTFDVVRGLRNSDWQVMDVHSTSFTVAARQPNDGCASETAFRVELGPRQALYAGSGDPLMIRYCGPQRYVSSTDSATNLYALEALIGGSQRCSAWAGDLPHRDANLVPGKWYDCLNTLNYVPTFSSYPATLTFDVVRGLRNNDWQVMNVHAESFTVSAPPP